jgi:hypothetical protein
MIDTDNFKSHWIPEHMLIANVISLAVKDACLEPYKNPVAMQWDAMTAHDFLWGEGLESYIHWLDIDVDFFRKKLIQTMANDREHIFNGIKSDERRAFRFNKKIWDRESERLGGRMANDKSARWRSVDKLPAKGLSKSSGNSVKHTNGIEALVQYHQTHSGE